MICGSSPLMKATVEENGVLIPRALLGDAREVEIVQEGDHVVVQPIPAEAKYSIWDLGKDPVKGGPPPRSLGEVADDPIWDLGTDPIADGVTDASVNHDRYFGEG